MNLDDLLAAARRDSPPEVGDRVLDGVTARLAVYPRVPSRPLAVVAAGSVVAAAVALALLATAPPRADLHAPLFPTIDTRIP